MRYHINSEGNVNTESSVQHVKPVSTSLLRNSSYESGYAARAYLRLLNHQDYRQAKDLYGKVKDPEVIEAVKEAHRAETRLVALEQALDKVDRLIENSKTDEQRAGNEAIYNTTAQSLRVAGEEFDERIKAIDTLKAKYAKQLAIHNRSLTSLERLANSGATLTAPKGIDGRIAALRKKRSETRSIKEISDILGKDADIDRVIVAAEAYGKPQYVASAMRYRELEVEHAILKERAEKLYEMKALAPTRKIALAISEEQRDTKTKLLKITPKLKTEERRVQLFKDEVRDLQKSESDVDRELAALVKIKKIASA